MATGIYCKRVHVDGAKIGLPSPQRLIKPQISGSILIKLDQLGRLDD